MDNTKHMKAFQNCFLNQLDPIDWTVSLSELHIQNKCILLKLASDKSLMRALIYAAKEDPYLWSKCEEDVVEDKIVLWDDMHKGIRIRLRMSTTSQQRLAHSHRFSFSNLVLRGKYIHWHYGKLDTFDDKTNLDDVRTIAQHVDETGDVFTIHHESLHSTPFPEADTVSLVLRGNPLKARAPVMFKEPRGRALSMEETTSSKDQEPLHAQSGDFFWRVGEDEESKERRLERQMRPEKIDYWINRLESFGLL